MSSSQTVIITGGTGYIGSHVAKELKLAGYRTAVIDLVPRAHTLVYADEFLNDSYDSPASIEFIGRLQPTSIVHCAGTSLVGPSLQDPAAYYVNNVSGTIRFLDGLRSLAHMPSLVFSSSAAVYGAPECDVIDETQPTSPISPYGRTKLMIEQILADFYQAYGLKSVSLRYFNACGADIRAGDLGQEPGATHIVARLLESLRDHRSFYLNGTDYSTPDGTCVRDYVHVNDLATAHVLAVEYLESQARCGAINLGTGKGYSNQEIIDAVNSNLGTVDVIEGPRRPGDPDRLVASNSRAQELLGWRPQYSDLRTIVTSAWKWYRNTANTIDIRPK